MKRKLVLLAFIMLFIAITLTACGSQDVREYSINNLPYTLKIGAYDFEKAIITNIQTNEIIEKTFDDILEEQVGVFEWRWLFSFGVGIKEDTKFIYTNDNRYITINEGLAYELIGQDTLKLQFPRWHGYDYNIYKIDMIFSYQKLYG